MTAAIILAAGRGSRLGRYTERLPKALVRIGGRSLLDWNLAALAACGIAPIVVVGGYRADLLRRRDVELVVSPDWVKAGPLASLQAAAPARFTEPFLVLYGDCVHHVDNISRLRDERANIAVAGDRGWRALWAERHSDPLRGAETYRHRDGMLLAIGARPHRYEEVEAQFAGLLRFSPAGWRSIERVLGVSKAAPIDMTQLLALLLAHDVAIADVPIDGRWCEVDSVEDVRLYRRRLRNDFCWSHDWRRAARESPCR